MGSSHAKTEFVLNAQAPSSLNAGFSPKYVGGAYDMVSPVRLHNAPLRPL